MFPDRSRTCKRELPSPARRLACFPFHHREHISFPLATDFSVSKSVFSSVGFDSHNPVPRHLTREACISSITKKYYLLPKGEWFRQDLNLHSGKRLGHPCSEPIELQNHCFPGFPVQQEQHYLVFILMSNPNRCVAIFENVLRWDSNPHEE